MGIQCKGLTNSLYIHTKRSNKKQNSRFSINDINNQDFRKFLKRFNSSPYLGLKIKQVHNIATEVYFFPVKYITKIMKSRGTFDPTF